jgi:Uma2 family endonuclease
MAAGVHADVLQHIGPWTEQDYLALPADRRRIELLDGSLLVSILIPDLAVVSTPGSDRRVAEPADVVLIVEITSPSNAAIDRAVKPQLYAQAGIPHYLLIELGAGPPIAVVFGLRQRHYLPLQRTEPGDRLRLDEPFGVDVDLAALATATRPPRPG